MTDRLRIAIAQLNPTVGDIDGNLAKVRAARAEAAKAGADLVVFGELVMPGYPPEDLVLKPFFQKRVRLAVEELAKETSDGGPGMLLTSIDVSCGKVFNAVHLIDGGEILATRHKHDLPNYGVFDEKRVFASGPLPGPVNFRGVRIGVPICEDMWTEEVVECLEESGAELLIVPNGSPFEAGKRDQRTQLAVKRVTESGLPLMYVNQVGGQDELVFDGGSFVINQDCSLAVQLEHFCEKLSVTEWERTLDGWVCTQGELHTPPDGHAAMYSALVLGLRDYVGKNGFPGIVLGLSGGIDSALSAAVAVDALGADKLHCLMMPSPYTSPESLEDAAGVALMLGVKLDEIGIGPAMDAFDRMLQPLFDDAPADVTQENIQARSRGITLMAISNRTGKMLLTTGNKSEMSVGYATLYGDMCGGFSVLKDIYKMDVFALSELRNKGHFTGSPPDLLGPDGPVMPHRVITKPPSAELRPDQKDSDSLPEYAELDDILTCLIEKELGIDDIVERGHAPETVARVWRLLDGAEYKRRQAPPGVKVTSRSFGRDRRYPITNGFRNILRKPGAGK